MSTYGPINLNNKRKDASQQTDINKRTRITLTALQKKELCERMRDDPVLKQKDMAREYNIAKQTVSDILRQQEIWLTIETGTVSAKRKRSRKPAFIEIDDAMKLWVEHVLISGNIDLSDSLIIERALAFAKEFGFASKFLASSGWLKNFKRRNNLRSYKKRGEIGSVNMEDIPNFRAELQDILKEYDYRDIFKCDETALYWQLEPDRSIAHTPLPGKKKLKERITLLLTCNASGDENLPVLLIHKYESPRALKGINKATLPVWYYWNAKAWMQRSIFHSYLVRLNSQMKLANRKILLLLDNASCHDTADVDNLSNVRLHFLPPNTTAVLQPLDQGIIYSLKVFMQ